ENTGWELELNTVNIQSKKLNWSTSVNISYPKNRLVAFSGLEESTYANLLEIGAPVNGTKRYLLERVNPQTGLYEFKDLNGDGSINSSDDRVILDLNPRYYGGISNSLNIGKLDIDLLVQFTKKNGRNFWSRGATPGRMSNHPMEILQRWKKEGDRMPYQQFSAVNQQVSSSFQKFK